MSESPIILAKLRKEGERITPLRKALIQILSKAPKPWTPQELLAALEKKGFSANKTTVYRQLEVLEKNKVIQSVQFTDRSKRYELVDLDDHHHHLVCLSCNNIEDISFPAHLEAQEKAIWHKNKFKVTRHSMEFFGICKNCQTKGK